MSQIEAIENGIKLDEKNVAICEENIRKIENRIPLETNSDVIEKLAKEKLQWEAMRNKDLSFIADLKKRLNQITVIERTYKCETCGFIWTAKGMETHCTTCGSWRIGVKELKRVEKS